jgi:hypothetical protein
LLLPTALYCAGGVLRAAASAQSCDFMPKTWAWDPRLLFVRFRGRYWG